MGYKVKLSSEDCQRCAIQNSCIISSDKLDGSAFPSYDDKFSIYHDGEEIYPQDQDLSNYIAIVRTGMVTSQFKHSRHHSLINNIYFPCDLIDFNMGFPSAETLHYISMDTTNLCFFKFEYLKNQQKMYISYLEKRTSSMTEMLSFQKSILIEYNAEKRIVFFLLFVISKKRMSGHNEIEFKINLTRLQIGFCIGVAEETVVRAIRNLAKTGLLKVKGKSFFIPRYQELVDFIDS